MALSMSIVPLQPWPKSTSWSISHRAKACTGGCGAVEGCWRELPPLAHDATPPERLVAHDVLPEEFAWAHDEVPKELASAHELAAHKNLTTDVTLASPSVTRMVP